ncbi:MAG: DUF4093 domain-containing protein, partial [Clostridia bacterium]|nr:DUF4093 domain-containing protein [Clostridia bacterium]
EYRKITTVDLYNDGFSGKENSSEKRKLLCSILKIPDNLSSKSIVKSINTSGGYPKYKAAIDALNDENK